MHEMSLAGNILQLVEEAAVRERFCRVAALRIEAGRLAGVETRALRFALDALAPGTCLEGAKINIDERVAIGWCADCEQQIEIEARALPCPLCGGFQIEATSGSELRVVDMLVQDN